MTFHPPKCSNGQTSHPAIEGKSEVVPRAGVTIAIPNWNHEVLLPRSISSALRTIAVLREQGVPGEVLVVDDCSRDGSLALLRQLEALYRADGLSVLAFATNEGLAASRNQAILNARFPYIVFLDADNELVPTNLPYFVRTLRETRAAAAYGTLLMRTVSARFAFGVTSNESVQPKLFEGNYIDALAIFDREQLLDVGGYVTGCSQTSGREDFELWLNLATNGRQIVFVPMVLGYYYVLPESMIQTTDSWETARNRIARVFDQVRIRSAMPMNTDCCRYHPDIGYIGKAR
jgi:succinoglycan biosynthesis protein ExoO